ncbi:nucleotidyltransferase domain-containing protein [Herbiconiux solani]|uniref:nucleotidyltransferase domain-containing protein n=1 Tax=Herbiconiux solani TaxID=661329 RepID=UPI0008263450|nr:nucleotidyltransferase domain-containing protein [Herbiconiux solani]
MDLQEAYDDAGRDAERARLRRVLLLRAMLAEGKSQREVAARFGVTQPAISYQVARERTDGVRPSELVAAGGSVLRHVAEEQGFTQVAMFGSAARGDDRPDSDLDLLVQPPAATDAFDMTRLEETLSAVFGRPVDLVSYRGLDPRLDQDILRDRVLL